MFEAARSFLVANRDAARRVAQAKTFAVRLPVVGRVPVPPPDQLAFYGALGLLAALELIDWPVAVAIGVGQAVVARHFTDRSLAVPPSARTSRPTRKAPAKKAAPKAAARKVVKRATR
jgi:hypothetical protein